MKNNLITSFLIIFLSLMSCVFSEPKLAVNKFQDGPLPIRHEGVLKTIYPRHEYIAENTKTSSIVSKIDKYAKNVGGETNGWTIKKLSTSYNSKSFVSSEKLADSLTQVFSFSNDQENGFFIVPGLVVVLFKNKMTPALIQQWSEKYSIGGYRILSEKIITLDYSPGLSAIENAEKIRSYDFVEDAYADIAQQKVPK
ncbi:hypothetical protein [Leptospira ryugenii]|nr:hypothetical protein [Leptospira ryugenii]